MSTKSNKGMDMKAMMFMLALFLGAGLLSGCAGQSADSGRSKVQVYGSVDGGVGYQSRSISRD
ncbi:hypothetical protein [Advenella mimigardefordensis]|uniref:hypothetical protein n=1 Tax=Advenella mimigardefordensis TaxID=302406 RepID=UPI0011823ECF|nr:hypothetical protein [Advenella mimigardefordensis]